MHLGEVDEILHLGLFDASRRFRIFRLPCNVSRGTLVYLKLVFEVVGFEVCEMLLEIRNLAGLSTSTRSGLGAWSPIWAILYYDLSLHTISWKSLFI